MGYYYLPCTRPYNKLDEYIMRTRNSIKKTFVVSMDFLAIIFVMFALLCFLVMSLIKELSEAERKLQAFYQVEHQYCQFKDQYDLHVRACQVLIKT